MHTPHHSKDLSVETRTKRICLSLSHTHIHTHIRTYTQRAVPGGCCLLLQCLIQSCARGGSGTREEPGTLTQGGALFSLVPPGGVFLPRFEGKKNLGARRDFAGVALMMQGALRAMAGDIHHSCGWCYPCRDLVAARMHSLAVCVQRAQLSLCII